MRCKYGNFCVVGLMVLLGSSGTVLAADRSPVRSVAQADASQGDGTIAVFQQVTSDKGKLRYAEDSVQEMRDALTTLQKKIDEARKNKDIVLLNCLNEKFSSINALLKVTETANILMQEALSQNNSQQADHQFRKVVIARFKVRQFLQEAAECSGEVSEPGANTEDVKVTVETPLTGDIKVTDPIGATTDPAEPPPKS